MTPEELYEIIADIEPERAARRIQFTTPFYEYRLEPVDGYFAYLYIPERTLRKLKEEKKRGKICKVV